MIIFLNKKEIPTNVYISFLLLKSANFPNNFEFSNLKFERVLLKSKGSIT